MATYRQCGRLLELGCGPGYFLAAAAEAGWQGTGLELSAYEADYGRVVLKQDIRSGPIEQVLPDEQFDVIVGWDVLEHLAEPPLVLSRLCAILRPGGALLLKMPDGRALETPHKTGLAGQLYRLYLNRVFAHNLPEHRFHFTAPVLEKILTRSGLSVKETQTDLRPAEIPLVSATPFNALAKRALTFWAAWQGWPYNLYLLAEKPNA